MKVQRYFDLNSIQVKGDLAGQNKDLYQTYKKRGENSHTPLHVNFTVQRYFHLHQLEKYRGDFSLSSLFKNIKTCSRLRNNLSYVSIWGYSPPATPGSALESKQIQWCSNNKNKQCHTAVECIPEENTYFIPNKQNRLHLI